MDEQKREEKVKRLKEEIADKMRGQIIKNERSKRYHISLFLGWIKLYACSSSISISSSNNNSSDCSSSISRIKMMSQLTMPVIKGWRRAWPVLILLEGSFTRRFFIKSKHTGERNLENKGEKIEKDRRWWWEKRKKKREI